MMLALLTSLACLGGHLLFADAGTSVSLDGKTMYSSSSASYTITLSDDFGKTYSYTHSPARYVWYNLDCDGTGDRVLGVSQCNQPYAPKNYSWVCDPATVSFDHAKTFQNIPIQPGFDYRNFQCERVAVSKASAWALMRCDEFKAKAERLFVSQDLLTWQSVGEDWYHYPIADVVISDDGNVFAVTNNTQVLVSADHGQTGSWTDAQLPSHSYTQLAINADGQTIAAGYSTRPAQRDEYAGGVMVTHDGGKSWEQVYAWGMGKDCYGNVNVASNAKGDLIYIANDCVKDYLQVYNASTRTTTPLVNSLKNNGYGVQTNAEGSFIRVLTYPQYCSHDFGRTFVDCTKQ